MTRLGPSRRVRFAGRAINNLVAFAPWTWPLLRPIVTRFFDASAQGWDERIEPDSPRHLAPIEAALAHTGRSPQRILDVGTGTGAAALMLADRFPGADVVGIDVAPDMIARARQKVAQRRSSARFEVADISRLRSPADFDLIAMLNMPPFFEPLSDLLAPGGYVVHASSSGAHTPFYTSPAALRRGFARRGLETVASGSAGDSTYFVARRPPA